MTPHEEPEGGSARSGRFLKILTSHPAVPTRVRRTAARIAGSPMARRLAHGAFWSLAGTALARVLALVVSVITARVLGRAEYGELGVINSTLLTLQAFASLGLGMTATKYVAELRATDPERTGRILALSTVMSVVTGLVATGLLWGVAPWLAVHTIDAPQLAGPLRIAAIGLFFTTMIGAQAGALAGFEAFRAITIVNAWSGLIGIPLAVTGVWLWGLNGAVWAMVATSAAQFVLGEVAVRTHARHHGIPRRLGAWWREQRVLWTFSVPAMAQGVMVTPVTWVATAILVTRPQGYLEMGALNAANQWYGAVLFLPTALGGAILPVLSESIGRGDAIGARKILRSAFVLNAAVVVPIVAIGGALSPWIMGLYGPGFRDAWPTLVAVLVTSAVVAATNPVGNVLAASGKLWLGFVMNSGWAAVFLGATLGMVRWGALGVATARLIAYAVHAGWTGWFAARFLRVSALPSPARNDGAPVATESSP